MCQNDLWRSLISKKKSLLILFLGYDCQMFPWAGKCKKSSILQFTLDYEQLAKRDNIFHSALGHRLLGWDPKFPINYFRSTIAKNKDLQVGNVEQYLSMSTTNQGGERVYKHSFINDSRDPTQSLTLPVWIIKLFFGGCFFFVFYYYHTTGCLKRRGATKDIPTESKYIL